MYGKIVISLALFAVAAHGLQLSEKAKAILKECGDEHKISDDQVKEAFENKKLPETEAGKCFLECVLTKGGVIKDGALDVERAQELALRKVKDELKEQAKEIIASCKDTEKPEGKCEYGLKLSQCVMEGMKKANINDAFLIDQE